MVAVIIAGSGSGAGKTSVGCALIAALSELAWVACKLSPHSYEPEPIWVETDPTSAKDTGRYLAAGAKRSYLISAPSIDLLIALLRDLDRQEPGSSLLIESNRVNPKLLKRTGRKVICLAILASGPSTWKETMRTRVSDSDALVLTNGMTQDRLPVEFQSKITFTFPHALWGSPDLTGFVRNRLLLAQG